MTLLARQLVVVSGWPQRFTWRPRSRMLSSGVVYVLTQLLCNVVFAVCGRRCPVWCYTCTETCLVPWNLSPLVIRCAKCLDVTTKMCVHYPSGAVNVGPWCLSAVSLYRTNCRRCLRDNDFYHPGWHTCTNSHSELGTEPWPRFKSVSGC